MSIAFRAFGVVALLAYIMSRIYLLVEIILVIPFMDPGVCQEPSFPSYWPHFGGCIIIISFPANLAKLVIHRCPILFGMQRCSPNF